MARLGALAAAMCFCFQTGLALAEDTARQLAGSADTFGCTPASVTIIPEKECPTSTVGPSCRASTCWAEATASGSVVSGFCTDVALSPAACNRAITSDQDDPSANSPCTRTTFLAAGADCAAAAVSWTKVLAAPAATM